MNLSILQPSEVIFIKKLWCIELISFTYDLGNNKTVEILIEKGANVRAKNNKGDTALYLAAKRGNLFIYLSIWDGKS